MGSNDAEIVLRHIPIADGAGSRKVSDVKRPPVAGAVCRGRATTAQFILMIGVAALLLVLAAARDAPPRPQPMGTAPRAGQAEETVAAVAAPPRYVGSASCGSCRERELRAWQGSQHQKAMREANAQTVLGDFDGARLQRAGVTTRFFRRDGGYRVRTEGPGGRLADYDVRDTSGVSSPVQGPRPPPALQAVMAPA